jgi:protein gp37
MSENTNIEWADHTYNHWIGCKAISPACDNCYAADWAKRYGRDFSVRTRTKTGRDPILWNNKHEEFFAKHGRRQRVFCNSLSDVFDNEVDPQWRAELFSIIAITPNLDWLILTKRIGNVKSMVPTEFLTGSEAEGIPANVWLGATICNQEEADRDVLKLLATPAAKRFLSIEPMLSAIDLTGEYLTAKLGRYPFKGLPAEHRTKLIDMLDWVICGGESGKNARPMHPDWVSGLRDQCAAANVPFLFKQWGEWSPRVNSLYLQAKPTKTHIFRDGLLADHIGKKTAGRMLDGAEHNGVPV